MARQKKPVHRVQMTEGSIIHQLLEEYDIQSGRRHSGCAQGSFWHHKEMMEAEMDDHLGYENWNEIMMIIAMVMHVRSTAGMMEIEVPQIANQRLNHRL